MKVLFDRLPSSPASHHTAFISTWQQLTSIDHPKWCHYCDVVMGVLASQITSLTIVYSTVYSGVNQSKHQSRTSLAFVWGIHWWLVISLHKWPVIRKMFPFDDVIMVLAILIPYFQWNLTNFDLSGIPMLLGSVWLVSNILSVPNQYLLVI